MKNKKPWYEKVNIWVTIIAGLCTIFGISMLDSKPLLKNDEISVNLEDNEVSTGDQSPFFLGDGDNEVIYQNYYANDKNENDLNLDINNINLSYAAATDERFKKVFLIDFPDPDNYSDLSILQDKYYIENNCVTIVNISNLTGHEIKLNKFRVVAENIIPNLEPVVITFFESGSSVDLTVLNDGWCDINNLKIRISDKNNILEEYYNKNDLEIEIPFLKSGDTKTIHILDKEIMKKVPDIQYDNAIIIEPIITIILDELVFSQETGAMFIFNEGAYVGEYGAGSACVYGITIDTKKDSFCKEFSINECIDSNDILDIPLCFFPDKSCNMKFHVEFDIYNGRATETIKSEKRQLDFRVSSTSSKWFNIDEDTINLHEAEKSGERFDYITFPINNKFSLQG